MIDVVDITADGDMKAISAKSLRLLGDIDIKGALLKLDLNSADAGHRISVGASVVPNPKAKLAIKINHAVDTSVSSVISIASIKAKEGWIDSDPEDDDVFTIEAPWMGKASFGGDVLVDLLLDGVGAPKGVALGGVKTKAGILGGLWAVLAGDVGSISTKTAIAEGWTGRFHEAHVKSIKAGTDASLDLEAASAKTISAKAGSTIRPSRSTSLSGRRPRSWVSFRPRTSWRMLPSERSMTWVRSRLWDCTTHASTPATPSPWTMPSACPRSRRPPAVRLERSASRPRTSRAFWMSFSRVRPSAN